MPFLSFSLWPGERGTGIRQTRVVCPPQELESGVCGAEGVPQRKSKYCYQEKGEWMLGRQDHHLHWESPVQVTSNPFLLPCRDPPLGTFSMQLPF